MPHTGRLPEVEKFVRNMQVNRILASDWSTV